MREIKFRAWNGHMFKLKDIYAHKDTLYIRDTLLSIQAKINFDCIDYCTLTDKEGNCIIQIKEGEYSLSKLDSIRYKLVFKNNKSLILT